MCGRAPPVPGRAGGRPPRGRPHRARPPARAGARPCWCSPARYPPAGQGRRRRAGPPAPCRSAGAAPQPPARTARPPAPSSTVPLAPSVTWVASVSRCRATLGGGGVWMVHPVRILVMHGPSIHAVQRLVGWLRACGAPTCPRGHFSHSETVANLISVDECDAHCRSRSMTVTFTHARLAASPRGGVPGRLWRARQSHRRGRSARHRPGPGDSSQVER